MTKLDPTQPGHMHSTMIWNGKIKKVKELKITRDKRVLAEDRENVAYIKPFDETDILEQWLV